MGRHIVVIGAGPAGLTAAYELLKNNQGNEDIVTILEESSDIGGISKTVYYQGNRMDIGGHRFFSRDERIVDWWKELLPVQGSPSFDDKLLGREKPLVLEGPDPEETDKVMLVRQRVSRIYYQKKFFDYPVTLSARTLIGMGPIRTIQAGCSYFAACLHKKPENSLENFYINRFGKVLYHMFFEGYTEKLWGRHPRDISADWGAQRVKGLSIWGVLKDAVRKLTGTKKAGDAEISLIEEFYYPKYGPGQLWEMVAGRIRDMGGRIIFNSSVIGLGCNGNQVIGVKYKTKWGDCCWMDADVVLSSMPLKNLTACMTQVPEKIRRIADGLPYRDFVTIGLLLKKMNLKNKTKIPTLGNIVPDCWIYVQDTQVKVGRIQIFNNWSPYMVKDAEHTVWVGLEYFCCEGDNFWNMTETEATDFAIKELIYMGIIESETDVLDSHRELVKKAYPAYFDTYINIHCLTEWLDQWDNLYCIGRNGQHRYNNMDHSMATAMEAVDNIQNGRKDKKNVWGVNTDKEYHESKKS